MDEPLNQQQSPEQIVSLLKAASAAVDASGLAPDLRVVGFERALALMVRGRVPSDVAATPVPSPETQDRLGILAGRLGVERDVAEYVFDAAETSLTLVMARSRLPAEKRRATRTIAILYSAGRQAAYDEEWTLVAAIREQCRLFGVLDSANFASAINAMSDALLFRGKGSDRAVKVTRAGFEEAGRMLRDLSH